MSAHTPGPWSAHPDGISVIQPHAIRQANGGAFVAHTYWDRLLMDDTDEPDANARLIAAAPDLLDALERVIAARERKDHDWLTQARAAVARARGGK